MSKHQEKLMSFDPASGEARPYPSHAKQWRDFHGADAWLFNPWSGTHRSAGDVGSDPFGMLIVAPGEPIYAAQPSETPKLWLWKNFVNGRPEYWAFDNPYPINLTDGDPQTLGEPCGYAIFKRSRCGRPDVSDEQVLRRIAIAGAPADPCPQCEQGGVCKTPTCGRLRSSELMRLYGTGADK